MRLMDFEQAAILSTVKCFDKNVRVYLFASRTDDTKIAEISTCWSVRQAY